MDNLPPELHVEILRRVGKFGFRFLGPFIASSKRTKAAVFTRVVLKSVDLSEMKADASMIIEGSTYRPFFRKCVLAGNITATELEGLRMLCQEGPSETAFAMVNFASPNSKFCEFVTAIFRICSGDFERGMSSMTNLWELVESKAEAIQLADEIISQIVHMGPARVGLYLHTHSYPVEAVPDCTLINCEATNVCECCYIYWYSLIVRSLC